MIVELATPMDMGDILRMAEKNPSKEYSCSFDDYAKYLLWGYSQKNFMFFVLKEDTFIAGYMILILNMSILNRTLLLFSIYIEEEFRGKGYVSLFTEHIANEFTHNEVDQVVFYSSVLPERYWKEFIPCNYKTSTVCTVNIQDYLSKEVT